jgi:cell wall-associated NlpC family hydrolase
MNRTDFIETARGFLGTPFHHQGRLPGVGLDCAGLVVCAARAHGYEVADVQGYASTPSQGLFTKALLDHCDPIAQADILPGDLMMFAFKSEPQHIAIVSGINPLTLLHAYAAVRSVVEHHLDAAWQSRLCACYRLRGINE